MKRTLSLILAVITAFSVFTVCAGAAENITTEIYQLSKTDYPVRKLKTMTDKYTEDFGKLGDVIYIVASDYMNETCEIITLEGNEAKTVELKDLTVQGLPENVDRSKESMYFCFKEDDCFTFYISGQKYTVTKTGKKKYTDIEYAIITRDFKTFSYEEFAEEQSSQLPENYVLLESDDNLNVVWDCEKDVYYTSTDLKNFTKVTFPEMKAAELNIDGYYDYYILKEQNGFLVWRSEIIDLYDVISSLIDDPTEEKIKEIIEKYSFVTYTSFPELYYTTDFVTFKKTDTAQFGEINIDSKTKKGVDFSMLGDGVGSTAFVVTDFVQNEIKYGGDIFELPEILSNGILKNVQTSIFFFNKETLAFEKKAVSDISYNCATCLEENVVLFEGETVDGKKAYTYINGEEVTNNYLINKFGDYETDFYFEKNYAVNFDEKFLYVSNDSLRTLYCFPVENDGYGNIFDLEDGTVYYCFSYPGDDTTESYVATADIDELVEYAKNLTKACDEAGTHVESSWIVDKESTPTEKGYRHKICERCGKYICGEETPVTVPYMVFLDSIKNTSKGVKLSWYESEGAQSYTVYRKSGSSSYKAIKTVSAKTTSFTDTDVKSGNVYTYTVKAKNSSGTSAYDKKGLSIRYLSAPTVKTSNTKSGISIKWNKIKGAQGYAIYRKTGSGSYKKIKTIKDGSTLSYTDTNVKSGTKYTYYVKAYYGKRYSSYKNTSAILRLSAAKITSAVSGKKGITVKWNKVSGAKGYYVYRKTGSGSYKKIATVKSGSTVTYLNKSAEKGKTYTYYIKAYNGSYSGTCANKVKCKDKY